MSVPTLHERARHISVTCLSQHPYVCGFRLVVLMAQWHVYYIPVDFALGRCTGTPGYRLEHALFHKRLRGFPPTHVVPGGL
jgi:hypothetical protein